MLIVWPATVVVSGPPCVKIELNSSRKKIGKIATKIIARGVRSVVRIA
jgi:hypothetical protein